MTENQRQFGKVPPAEKRPEERKNCYSIKFSFIWNSPESKITYLPRRDLLSADCRPPGLKLEAGSITEELDIT